MGKDDSLGRLGAQTIVPTEAVFDAASALAEAISLAMADLAVAEPIVVGAQLRRVDAVRRATYQFERAVVAQAARALGVAVPAVQVEPKVRMLDAASSARRAVTGIADLLYEKLTGDDVDGIGKLQADATVAIIGSAIGDLQKLARLIEQAAAKEGRVVEC
jgi:hypothetical protein